MNAYLIVVEASKDAPMLATLNGSNLNWLRLWAGAMIVQSPTNLHGMTEWLHQHHPNANFLVSQILLNSTTMGWMSKNVWDFLQAKQDEGA